MSSTNDRSPEELLAELSKGLRRMSFSRRAAASIKEASDPNVVWGVKSLDEVLEALDHRQPVTPTDSAG